MYKYDLLLLSLVKKKNTFYDYSSLTSHSSLFLWQVFFSHSSKNIKKPRSKDLPPYTFSSILSHVMIPSLTSYFPFFFCKNMEVTGATFGAVDCFFFLSFNLFRSSFVLWTFKNFRIFKVRELTLFYFLFLHASQRMSYLYTIFESP